MLFHLFPGQPIEPGSIQIPGIQGAMNAQTDVINGFDQETFRTTHLILPSGNGGA